MAGTFRLPETLPVILPVVVSPVGGVTVTFVAAKSGFSCEGARLHLGEVVVGDIGLPVDWVRRVLDL